MDRASVRTSVNVFLRHLITFRTLSCPSSLCGKSVLFVGQ